MIHVQAADGGTLMLEDADPFEEGAHPGAMAVIRLPLVAVPEETVEAQKAV